MLCILLYCSILYDTTLFHTVHTVLSYTSLQFWHCFVPYRSYCMVFFCTVLFCNLPFFSLFCSVLHCTTLYCIVLYCAEFCCSVMYYTVLHRTALYFIVWRCIVLRCISLHAHYDIVPYYNCTVQLCRTVSRVQRNHLNFKNFLEMLIYNYFTLFDFNI
jgi:hypothetical protein